MEAEGGGGEEMDRGGRSDLVDEDGMANAAEDGGGGGENWVQRRVVRLRFEGVHLGKPSFIEADKSVVDPLLPMVARLRRLSYAAQLRGRAVLEVVLQKSRGTTARFNGERGRRWQNAKEGEEEREERKEREERVERLLDEGEVHLGCLPIMLMSSHCHLKGLNGQQLAAAGEDEREVGGYFVVEGTERVVCPQLMPAWNRLVVSFNKDEGRAEASVLSMPIEDDDVLLTTSTSRFTLSVNFSSNSRLSQHSTSPFSSSSPPLIVAHLPCFSSPVPFPLLLRAFGPQDPSDRSILEAICSGGEAEGEREAEGGGMDEEMAGFLLPSLMSREGQPKTREASLSLLAEKFSWKTKSPDYIRNYLDSACLPHIGIGCSAEVTQGKSLFISAAVRRLVLCCLNRAPFDSRASLENKRVETTGHLFANLFRHLFSKLCRDAAVMLRKKLGVGQGSSGGIGGGKETRGGGMQRGPEKDGAVCLLVKNLINGDSVTLGFRRALATGSWPRFDPSRMRGMALRARNRSSSGSSGNRGSGSSGVLSGVTDKLPRMCHLATLAKLRQIHNEIPTHSINHPERQLTPSHFGRFCCLDSSEGPHIGQRLHLAIFALISLPSSQDARLKLQKIINDRCISLLRSTAPTSHSPVAIWQDGRMIGVTEQPLLLMEFLRKQRRRGALPSFEVEFRFCPIANQLTVETGSGRILRSLAPNLQLPSRPSFLVPSSSSSSSSPPFPSTSASAFPLHHPSPLHPLLLSSSGRIFLQNEAPSHQQTPQISTSKRAALNPSPAPPGSSSTSGRDGSGNSSSSSCSPPNATWTSLLLLGAVECIGAEEERAVQTASCWRSTAPPSSATHFEVDPSAPLGVVGCSLPLANHNGAARNVVGARVMTQSVGFPSNNCLLREEPSSFLLHYPQKPLVASHLSRVPLGGDDLPSGQNCIVAIMCSDGYNQEDAIIVSQAAVDRGLFCSTGFKTKTMSEVDVTRFRRGEKFHAEPSSRFERPDPAAAFSPGLQSSAGNLHLRESGMPRIGVPVFCEGGIVNGIRVVTRSSASEPLVFSRQRWMNLIGRTTELSEEEKRRRKMEDLSDRILEFDRRDSSLAVSRDDFGIVHSVSHPSRRNIYGIRMAAVKIRTLHLPQLGDKFSSRHGQKGVVGQLAVAENLCWTANGVVPDVIINPHALPSRMTVGQLIEMVVGKVRAFAKSSTSDDLLPQGSDWDQFCSDGQFAADKLAEELKKLGFSPYHLGSEEMYSGVTGIPLQAHVFVGPAYYLRLKHLVCTKIATRGDGGPTDKVTRQPVEGRAKGGGFRLGEMERNCLIVHGASRLITERFMDLSDGCHMAVCKRCHVAVCEWGDALQDDGCLSCGRKNHFQKMMLPFAMKLLMDELHAVGIRMRVYPKERDGP